MTTTMRKVRKGQYHIETEGAILNILEGLEDRRGRKATSIEVLPDDHFQGEPKWVAIPNIRRVKLVRLKTVKG